ncbi:MAG: hypothetical protein SGBAC_002605 [Bacillariaceae sp.]
MGSEKDQPEADAKKPLTDDEESDGTVTDDSSQKDGESDGKIDEEEDDDLESTESKQKERKDRKTKKDKDKTKKKTKKKKEKKDKKDRDKKVKDRDKKKKKLPPVVAPDYVHCERDSHHSRVSAITIPKPLQKIAKKHPPNGPTPDDTDYPEPDSNRGILGISLPKSLTIGGGDHLLDDSQRSGRISMLSVPPDESMRSSSMSMLDEVGLGLDTSLLDG